MTRAARLLLALVVLALVAAPAAGAAHKPRNCPAKRGTLAKNSYGRVWHQGKSLYACTTVYGRKPRAVRLGPWRGHAKVAWDGVTAAWTVPLVREGTRSDRVWIASAESGRRWVAGARAVPASASGAAHEGRIAKLVVDFEGAAWVTAAGDVVLVVHQPQADPKPVGTLPAALQASDKYLLVGSWPGTPAADLAGTLTLKSTSEDGDECGGVDLYTLTVKPQADADPVGATWDGAWERVDCG